MNDIEKIELAIRKVCGKCSHGKCGTDICPLTHVTGDDLLNYYEHEQKSERYEKIAGMYKIHWRTVENHIKKYYAKTKK